MAKISCYNRGCGKDYDPEQNTEDACTYHPGVPYFHDAYKGWTCCNKKSVDFTEFLNIKGCTVSCHSNVKPPEPEKTDKNVDIPEKPAEPPTSEPVKSSALIRSSFEAPLVPLATVVAPGLKQSIDNLAPSSSTGQTTVDGTTGEVVVGSMCKNGGCNCVYESPATNDGVCIHHPGVPIFHEGMKYWSCCNKKTTDFSSFLNQKGCTEGKHKWIKPQNETEQIKCRYDWHQTATSVVIAIYAKQYHYAKSFVKMNPIRLNVVLVFPQQHNSEFSLDLELRGIVDVSKTKVQMLGTKVEITLAKAEPGSWPKLDFPRKVVEEPKEVEIVQSDNDDSDVDLDNVEAVRGCTISEEMD